MSEVNERIEIDLPVRQTYDHWTRFESFPDFMEGIEEVEQVNDTTLRFRGEIGGVERTWKAQITEQVPDKVIAWTSLEGPENGGAVRFKDLDGTRTEVDLTLHYEPQTFPEKIGDITGVFKHRVKSDLKNFRKYVTTHEPVAGWRGEVHAGVRTD